MILSYDDDVKNNDLSSEEGSEDEEGLGPDVDLDDDSDSEKDEN